MKRNFTLFLILLFSQTTVVLGQLDSRSIASTYSGCPPLVVNFTDLSTGNPGSYEWDFDNGNAVSPLQNPTTSYPNPGVYNIRHVVFNGPNSDTEYILIRVFDPPKVDFGAPDNRGCIQPCHTVHFTNMTLPGESPVSLFVWNFGDTSQPVQAYNAQNCYSTIGSFDITLVARDENGCQVSLTKQSYVQIGSQPTASLSIGPVTKSCVPRVFNFTGSGTTNNPPLIYEWYFMNPNGTGAGQTASQFFNNGIYMPVLVVSDALGCQATDTGLVEVTDVMAGFAASSVNACQGIPTQFTDTSNFAQRWIWDFGDGTPKDTTRNPSHAYATTGPKTVTLIVQYNNCSDTITKTNYINVSVPLAFSFTGTPVTSCAPPLVTNFTYAGPTASSYAWDFGDGNTSTAQNPSNSYTANGSYTVRLSVGNAQGCVNTQTRTNYVSIADLDARFVYDSTQGCTPLVVRFTDSSKSNPPVTNYRWDFGDNTAVLSCNCPNPTHTYTTQGQYTVKLIITNSAGCVDSSSSEVIKVGGKLFPKFWADPLIQCVDQTVNFHDTAQGITNVTQFIWNFGDGGTSPLHNPTHTYRDTGTYSVTLSIINQGCRTDSVKTKYIRIIVPKAEFYFKTSCANAINVSFYDTSIGAETWLWDFGDGSPTETGRYPTHIYPATGNYKITLTVSNSSTGCVDSLTRTIQVGNAQAGFTVDTIAGCAPVTLSFKDTSAFSTSWVWRYTNGTRSGTSTAKNPFFLFSDTGRYTVSLVVTTAGGCRDSIGKVNYITIYGVKPNYGVDPSIGCAPLNVTFRDSSTSFLGTVTGWKWRFGTANGDSSLLRTPTYRYDTSGVITSTLRVTDSHGCTATISKPIQTTKPLANFRSDTAICPGEPVRFTNTSVNGSAYLWNFGSGINDTSTQVSPVHYFPNAGQYTITLIARNGVTGCPDTLVRVNYLNVDSPSIDFYVQSAFLSCPPFPVQFYNVAARPGLRYDWLFGDGGTAKSVISPLHVYFFPGEYDVTAIAYDTAGCTVSKTYPKMIKVGGPKGNFTATPDSGCVPLTVSISGSVSSTTSIVADLGDGPPFYDTINLVHTYRTPGNYYPVYTLTDSLNCIVAYPIDTIVVGIIPYPNLPDDTTVCKGNYVQFNLPYGDHFLWESNPSPTFLTCDTCKSPLSKATDTLTYYVTAITNIGCIAKDTITMYVDALPQVLPGLAFRICSNDTLQLSAGGNSSAATWTPNQYISDTSSLNPQVWPPDTTTYRVTAANSAGCTISRIVKVWPISNVEGSANFNDTLLCEGNAVQLQAFVQQASVNDTFYRWTPAKYLNSSGSPNPVFSPPPGSGEYDYQLIIGSNYCTPDTENIHISIHSDPVIESGDDQTVADGTGIQIWANSVEPNMNYEWIPSFDSLSCITCRRPNLVATRTQTIYVTAENEYGCKTIDSVVINVVSCDDRMIFVPNTFTPNNDGLNDRLYVRGIGLRQLEYFRIFDRWGTMVWQTRNLDEGWDGIIGGKLADVATYVYVLKGTCSSGSVVEKSGNVTLVR